MDTAAESTRLISRASPARFHQFQNGLPIPDERCFGRPRTANPAASDLAMSLNNLGGDLSDFGRPEEALDATTEAVDTFRQLIRNARTDLIEPLRRALLTHADILDQLNRTDDATKIHAEHDRLDRT